MAPFSTAHRRRLIGFALAVGVWALLASRDGEVDRLLETRFTPDPAADVVLYTTSWCGYCAQARRFLEANGVAYREIDVEASDPGRDAWEGIGALGVPVFVIDGHPIQGLDLRAVIDALSLEARAAAESPVGGARDPAEDQEAARRSTALPIE